MHFNLLLNIIIYYIVGTYHKQQTSGIIGNLIFSQHVL